MSDLATATLNVTVSPGTQTSITTQNSAESGSPPALAPYNGNLYMAYRGWGTSTSLYSCWYDGSTWHPQTNITLQNNAQTSAAPALAPYGDDLYMAYLGWGASTSLYCCYFDGTEWQPQTDITTAIGAQSGSSPALAAYNGLLYLAYRGWGASTSVYTSYFDGSNWHGQTNVTDANGVKTSSPPALAAYQGKLYMATRGWGTSDNLYVASFDGSSWSDQTKVATDCYNDPNNINGPALASDGTYLYLMYDSGSSIEGYAFDGSEWSGKFNFTNANSAVSTLTPAVAGYGNGFYSAFLGANGSNNLWGFPFTVS